jgi:hypothetical protein
MFIKKWVLGVFAAIAIGLCVKVAFVLGQTSAARGGDENSDTKKFSAIKDTDATVGKYTKKEGGLPPTTNGTEALTAPFVSACYHLDNCGYGKILSKSIIAKKNEERLLKASIRWGDVSHAKGNETDLKNIKWNRTDTVYALCSSTQPRIAFTINGKMLAEEIDMTDVPGVIQNSADLYQALCHKKFSNEIVNNPSAFGYSSIPDGGRGQYDISKPADLFD